MYTTVITRLGTLGVTAADLTPGDVVQQWGDRDHYRTVAVVHSGSTHVLIRWTDGTQDVVLPTALYAAA
jgi:hypothetical protein